MSGLCLETRCLIVWWSFPVKTWHNTRNTRANAICRNSRTGDDYQSWAQMKPDFTDNLQRIFHCAGSTARLSTWLVTAVVIWWTCGGFMLGSHIWFDETLSADLWTKRIRVCFHLFNLIIYLFVAVVHIAYHLLSFLYSTHLTVYDIQVHTNWFYHNFIKFFLISWWLFEYPSRVLRFSFYYRLLLYLNIQNICCTA